jgi:hypothetical protein
MRVYEECVNGKLQGEITVSQKRHGMGFGHAFVQWTSSCASTQQVHFTRICTSAPQHCRKTLTRLFLRLLASPSLSVSKKLGLVESRNGRGQPVSPHTSVLIVTRAQAQANTLGC